MRRRSGAVAVLACAATALCALLWAGSLAPQGAKTADGAGTVERVARAVRDAPVAPSSASSFLDDLGAAARSEADSRGVSWEDDKGLVDCAAEVLGAYREAEGVELVTSGYLDLKGDAWGALLRGDEGWVDVVAVYAGRDSVPVGPADTEREAGRDDLDDEGSRVRIVRITAGGEW